MGDAEVCEENSVLENFGPFLESDVLKVAHHGSRSSSTERFLLHARRSADHTIALVSAGRRNRYGHPHPQIVTRLVSNGFRLHSTATNNALWIRSDGRTSATVDWHR
jgi:competence protein ComEC